MRDATDEQLKAGGWKWALRFDGRLMAVSVSTFDAARWVDERAGDVVNLETGAMEGRTMTGAVSEKLNQRLARDLQEALGACGALGGALGYPDRHADLMRFEARDVATRLEKVAALIRQDVAEDEVREGASEGARQ
jgi:hypothetical protein